MAWLTAIDGAHAGRRFPLDATFLVGRGPYNHAVLDDVRISRQHAKVSPEAGGHVVYDLNSANGTFVNDVRVKRHPLSEGDMVRFGPFSFCFELDSDQERLSSRRMRTVRGVEEPTRRGFEAPTKIVDSLDAISAAHAVVPAGLVELEDAERKLRTLYGFMQAVSTTLDEPQLIDGILRHLLEVFPSAGTVAAYFYDTESGNMEPRMVLQRGGAQAPGLTLPTDIQEAVVQQGRAILSAPLTLAAPDAASPVGGSMMHAPMMYRDVAQGVLNVRAKKKGASFTQGDLDLFTGIAAQAAMALKNAHMHEESLKQQRLRQDLVLAEQIQKSFLPASLPDVAGMEFVSEYRPAFSVGGDFYDVFWLSPGRLGVLLGDVSGKGVSAALLMARVSSDLRAAALAEPEPARALDRVNKQLIARAQPDLFVTAIFLTIDVKTWRVVFSSAGHLPPYVRRARTGTLARVDGGVSTPLGLVEEAEYDQVELSLRPGDTLVLYTDGVIEATDASAQQLGFEGLERSLREAPSSRARDLATRLHDDIKAHVGDASQYDDLTLLLCGVVDR